jgi:hypothetical protein
MLGCILYIATGGGGGVYTGIGQATVCVCIIFLETVLNSIILVVLMAPPPQCRPYCPPCHDILFVDGRGDASQAINITPKGFSPQNAMCATGLRADK